jgi:hypothetical protein
VKRALFAVASLTSVLALVGAGCGGDDDDDGGGASNVTKEEFIANADEICAGYTERGEALGDDLAADASTEEVSAVILEDALPLFREQIAELRELDLPEADADELEQLWDDLEAGADEFEQQLEDDPEVALSDDFDPFAEANAFATEYGMEECGSS